MNISNKYVLFAHDFFGKKTSFSKIANIKLQDPKMHIYETHGF